MPPSASAGPESLDAALRSLEQRSSVFMGLVRRCNQATTVREAAEALIGGADQLVGWDACSLDLYAPETDRITCIVAMDVVGGRRADVTSQVIEETPSARLRSVLAQGGQLVLRDAQEQAEAKATPFGDRSRRSASLLYVPLAFREGRLGVLTVQSYRPGAYTRESLEVLQALADLGAGAIDRIRTEQLLQRTEELYRRAIGGAGAVPYVYDYRSRSYAFIGEGIQELIGYSPREMQPQLWARIIQESLMRGEASGLDKDEAARRVQSGDLRTWRCDMRVLTRDGKSRWIADASVQSYDEFGRAIGSMGILEDITERKQSELAALALSKLSRELLTAPDARKVASILSAIADELFGWDACSFHLYLPDTDEILPVLYQDIVEGRRVEVQRSRAETKPSPVDRRVITRGAELVHRDAAVSTFEPGAIPYGDKSRPSASIMRVPIRMRSERVTGVVSLHSYTPGVYTGKDLNTLQTLADCCGVALERIRADEQLRQLHQQLMEVSRQTGMAEVATSVLHNVGNVLNSVNVSSALIASKVRASKASNLAKAAELLQAHREDLAAFLAHDPRGARLPAYLQTLAEHLAKEQAEVLSELDNLGHNIEHINEIVSMQQRYATACGLIETLPIVDLVEDALRLTADGLQRHQVRVIRQYENAPTVPVDKHKALQILVNLIRNAKQALQDRGHADKLLTLRVELDPANTVKISVADNGIGIPPENLTRIFEYGFSTRKDGHGFGLHNSALAARELGGRLTAQSPGPSAGATFTLELPCSRKRTP